MPKTHPHAEATYRVIPLDDGSFGIEVTIPGSHPTRISTFKTEADAETWIDAHRARVSDQTGAGRWFRRSSGLRR
jgi:hypothetical protein